MCEKSTARGSIFFLYLPFAALSSDTKDYAVQDAALPWQGTLFALGHPSGGRAQAIPLVREQRPSVTPGARSSSSLPYHTGAR